MNQLTILGNNILTMSSLEIAELVQSRHYDVKRSIERLAEKGVIRLPPMAFSENINNLGFAVKSEMYVFAGEHGKLDSITVVAQLCPQFTAALVKRWYELENQQPKVQSGYLTHVEYRYESKSTGAEKLVAQVYVTPKGLAKLAQKLAYARWLDLQIVLKDLGNKNER